MLRNLRPVFPHLNFAINKHVPKVSLLSGTSLGTTISAIYRMLLTRDFLIFQICRQCWKLKGLTFIPQSGYITTPFAVHLEKMRNHFH